MALIACKLFAVVSAAAAGAAHREARPQHARQTDVVEGLQRFAEAGFIRTAEFAKAGRSSECSGFCLATRIANP